MFLSYIIALDSNLGKRSISAFLTNTNITTSAHEYIGTRVDGYVNTNAAPSRYFLRSKR